MSASNGQCLLSMCTPAEPTSNGTIRLSDALFRDWLRLPDHIGIVGLEFDGRTITVKIHDLHHADKAQAEYTIVYKSVSCYDLKEIIRQE